MKSQEIGSTYQELAVEQPPVHELLFTRIRDILPQLEQYIGFFEQALELTSPAQKFLETCLFIDQKFVISSILTQSPLPIERMFGDVAWAQHLQARLYTRQEQQYRYGISTEDIAMRVQSYLTGVRKIHPFRNYKGGRGGQFIDDTFLPLDLTTAQINSLKGQKHVSFLPADQDNTGRGYIKYPDMTQDAITTQLEQLYMQSLLIRDPYQAAAAYQQGVIGIHPCAGAENAANGRMSRILMNWLLARKGCTPCILPDFDDDIFSTPQEWAGTVRAGCHTYEIAQQRIDAGHSDPAAILGITPLKTFYDYTYRPSPGIIIPEYHPETIHPHHITDNFLQDVRSQAAAVGII